jgi:hypothetical protein
MTEETLLELTLCNRVTFCGIVNLTDQFFLPTRHHLSAFDVTLPSMDSRQWENLTAL